MQPILTPCKCCVPKRHFHRNAPARISSFLSRQNHLLSLAPTFLVLLLCMLSLILFFPFHGLELLGLNFTSFLDNLWNVSMTFDTPNFRHMCVSFWQSFVILQGLALFRGLNTLPLRCIGSPVLLLVFVICARYKHLPNPDIPVVGARKNVSIQHISTIFVQQSKELGYWGLLQKYSWFLRRSAG